MTNLTQYILQYRSYFHMFKIVLGMVSGCIIFFLLFKRVDPLFVFNELKGINFIKLTFAAILVILSYLCRTLTWKKLLNNFYDYSYWSAFRSTMIGYLINNILPARLGDLFRGIWLYRSQGGSKGIVLGTLVLERVMDLSIVLIIFVISLVSISYIQEWIIWTIFSLAAVIICFFVVVGTLIVFCQRAQDGFPAWVYSIKDKFVFLNRFNFKKHFNKALQFGSSMNLTNARRGFFWSIITWFVTFWGLFFAMQSLGPTYNVGVLGMGLILSIASLGVAVPSLPASLGTYQAAFVFGAIMAGLPEPKALSVAILYHGLWIVVTSILGLCSLLWEGMGIRGLFEKVRGLT